MYLPIRVPGKAICGYVFYQSGYRVTRGYAFTGQVLGKRIVVYVFDPVRIRKKNQGYVIPNQDIW